MDHADEGDNDDVFVYMGGSVPQHLRDIITHIRIHESVKIITARAFQQCISLESVEMHDGVEIIEEGAFEECRGFFFKRIKLIGVRVIGEGAFYNCTALMDVEFGDKLETIGDRAFDHCFSLSDINIPKVRAIGCNAFRNCYYLTEAEFSEDLETIEMLAFYNCTHLRRIALPLKHNLLANNVVFVNCANLSQLDLIGVERINKTISSLLLESWRNEMNDEIERINQDLPNTPTLEKTALIRGWMRSVLGRIEHYKSEHCALLKELTTLLELALWKVKLDEKFEEASNDNEVNIRKKAKIDLKASRQEQHITSGANVVIKNVLPFLKLE